MSIYLVSWSINKTTDGYETVQRSILGRLRAFNHIIESGNDGNMAFVVLAEDRKSDAISTPLLQVMRREDSLAVVKVLPSDKSITVGEKTAAWLKRNGI